MTAPLDNTAEQLAAFNRIMRDVRERLAGKRATQASPDGSVTVTVTGNGEIVRLELARGAVRRVAELGDTIRDTVNTARAEAGRRSSRLVYRAFHEDPEFTMFEFDEEAVK